MSERSLASRRIRKNFGKIRKIVDIPDLIAVQRESYNRFLQMDVPPEKREDAGLQAVFQSVFPIKDFTGSASLEFVSYRFAEVKHSVEECIHRGMTYEIPVRITVRLVVYDIDAETGVSNIRDIKEQEIYFGTIPLMTEKGTFIFNSLDETKLYVKKNQTVNYLGKTKITIDGKTLQVHKFVLQGKKILPQYYWVNNDRELVMVLLDNKFRFILSSKENALQNAILADNNK